MHQDPVITRYTGDPIPWDSVERVEKILEEVIFPQYKNNMGRWAVHLKHTGDFIGWCGLKDIETEIDLGYRFLQKYWGNGYATEAAKAVLMYGINVLQLKQIAGKADLQNAASICVLKKTGLSFKENYVEENGAACARFTWEQADTPE